jgi:3-hydroxyisobutyrate dehydrogenase
MTTKKERVGFIGLGIMGMPMAGHIANSGYPVVAFDIDPGRTADARSHGLATGVSAADVAARSDITITMVPDSQDVEQAVAGDHGVMSGAKNGSVLIDMSTISPAVGKSLSVRLAQRGIDMLDAPVSGGMVGAQNATLTVFAGGKAEVFERCLPILRTMGKAVTYMGPAGSGHTAKLANQVLGVTCLIGVAEALVFARKAGLDLRTFYDAAIQGAGTSWHLEKTGPKILDGDFAPGFMAKHMQKDVRLALEAAGDVSAPMPVTAVIGQLYRALQAQGPDRMTQGHHAIVQVLEELGNAQARA